MADIEKGKGVITQDGTRVTRSSHAMTPRDSLFPFFFFLNHFVHQGGANWAET